MHYGGVVSYERGTPVQRPPLSGLQIDFVNTPSVDHPEREVFIDRLLVQIHLIIVMITWTGLAPSEFEISFPGSLTSTLLVNHPCTLR